MITKTHIGWGSPKQDSEKAHGEPLGKDNVLATKKNYGWPSTEPFFVPDEALAHWRKAKERGAKQHAEWNGKWTAYASAFPDDAKELERRLAGKRVPRLGGEDSDVHEGERQRREPRRVRRGAERDGRFAPGARRRLGRPDAVEQHVGQGVEELRADDYAGRYMHFGIREHGMGAIMNGMAIHGGRACRTAARS